MAVCQHRFFDASNSKLLTESSVNPSEEQKYPREYDSVHTGFEQAFIVLFGLYTITS